MIETPRQTLSRLGTHPLMEYSRTLQGDDKGIGIAVFMSRLSRRNLTRNRLRLAVETFDNAVKQYRGDRFVLETGDLVMAFWGAGLPEIQPLLDRLRHLFSDDPIFAVIGDNPSDAGRLFSRFDLPLERRSFSLVISQLARHPVMDLNEAPPPEQSTKASTSSKKFHVPCDLGRAVDIMAGLDIKQFLRRQIVCRLEKDTLNAKPLFAEIYTSMSDLRRQLSEAGDILVDRVLFQCFTHYVDQMVLAFLTSTDVSQASRSFSLNINVATILSEEFRKLNTNLSDQDKPSIVFELQLSDIYADIGGFLFARDSLREQGYRICIDGMTPLTLPYANPDALGVDFVKVFIPADMVAMTDESIKNLGSATKQHGRRIILCRCASREMATAALGFGVQIFQGAFVDQLIKAKRQGSNG